MRVLAGFQDTLLTFSCNLRGMRGERAAVAVRTVASVFQDTLCVLWLLPSPGHPTAGARFQIHADVWHRLEASFLSAVSRLARPATFPMSGAMICDRSVRSDGALAAGHAGLRCLTS